MRAIAFVAAFVIAGSAVAQGVAPPKAPHGAKVFIVSPKNGATVGQDVHVVFGAKGITIAPATDTAPGTGHHHL
ncbi:MAG: rod shape-determining protein RodA, partial [Xanthomonadaceae bacterium]|nr:rod shape-determining protein RodA [Xanthomonadaceae bacterium]